MTIKEIASHLNVTPLTVKRWVKLGRLKVTLEKHRFPQTTCWTYIVEQEEFERFIKSLKRDEQETRLSNLPL